MRAWKIRTGDFNFVSNPGDRYHWDSQNTWQDHPDNESAHWAKIFNEETSLIEIHHSEMSYHHTCSTSRITRAGPWCSDGSAPFQGGSVRALAVPTRFPTRWRKPGLKRVCGCVCVESIGGVWPLTWNNPYNPAHACLRQNPT